MPAQVTLQCGERQLPAWSGIESDLGLSGDVERVIVRDERGSRIYLCKDTVVKVQLVHSSFRGHRFFQCLEVETESLMLLAGSVPVPKVIDFWRDGTKAVLVQERVTGIPLHRAPLRLAALPFLLVKLARVALRLCGLRVVHGDLNVHNIMLSGQGDLTVIDFGMAQKASLRQCVWHNIFSRGLLNGRLTFPVSGAMIRCVEFSLPERYRAGFRRLVGIAPYVPNSM